MSVSSYYSDFNLYLKDVCQFLNEFRWIYTSSNTEFVTNGTLREIPSEWITTISSLTLEELNEIPFGLIQESWPATFRDFLTCLKRLKPQMKEAQIDPNCEVEAPFQRGIKPKKIHEICELSKEISLNCGQMLTDSPVVVDLGCGVGHLTQFLHAKYHYKLLGIEADTERVRTANHLKKTRFPKSERSVHFVQHYIKSDSVSFINSYLTKEFGLHESPELILTGLHSCADLSVTSLNIFLQSPNVKKLLIMPCCYHKMKFKENSKDEFENVPLSRLVKSLESVKGIVNRPFLRLAGQQTASRWRSNSEAEHKQHGQNMWHRAAIQAILSEDETVEKNKKPASNEALDQYTLLDKHTKTSKIWSNQQILKFTNLIQEYPNGDCLSEFLTCLQASIQSICENLVLLDRLVYVMEESTRLRLNVTIRVKKIVNEDISPRCFVMVANKN